MDELKPCPFCGGLCKVVKAKEGWQKRWKWGIYVKHKNKKCILEFVDFGLWATKKYAIEAWNTRSQDGGNNGRT